MFSSKLQSKNNNWNRLHCILIEGGIPSIGYCLWVNLKQRMQGKKLKIDFDMHTHGRLRIYISSLSLLGCQYRKKQWQHINVSAITSIEAAAGIPQLLWKHFATSLFLNSAKLKLNVKWEKQHSKIKVQTQPHLLIDLKNRMQPPIFPSKLIGDVEETTVTTVANYDRICKWATNEKAPDEHRQIWNYTNIHQDLAAYKINTLWLVTQLMINNPLVRCV